MKYKCIDCNKAEAEFRNDKEAQKRGWLIIRQDFEIAGKKHDLVHCPNCKKL